MVDTPGLREVGIRGLPSEELDCCFLEFRAESGKCRFQDCHHLTEPACAVRAAVSAGKISNAPYESFVKLRAEVVEGEGRY